jgi:hypothetical protein
MAKLFASGNMGEGSGAESWLVGDVNNDGQAEIIQLWNNGGLTGMIVYYWTGSVMSTLSGNSNVEQDGGALSWFVVDVNRDGRARVPQPWSNGGQLGITVYQYPP